MKIDNVLLINAHFSFVFLMLNATLSKIFASVSQYPTIIPSIKPTLGNGWVLSDSPSIAFYAIALSCTGEFGIAIATGGDVYRSSDFGASWVNTGHDFDIARSLACDCTGQYAVSVLGQFSAGCTSSDYGQNWSCGGTANYNNGAGGVYPNAVIASDDSGSRVIIAEQGIWMSTDYGHSYIQRFFTTSIRFNSACSDSTGQYLAVCSDAFGSDGGIYQSDDYGLNWTLTAYGANYKDIACSADGRYLFAVIYGGRVRMSHDYGQSWILSYAITANWVSIASSASGALLVAAASGGDIHISNDFGISWRASSYPISDWNSVAMDRSGRIIVAGFSEGIVVKNMSLLFTDMPTSFPSSQPSSQPSKIPSSQPSMLPSAQPSSAQPTSQPAGQPSSQPSKQPSTQPSTQPGQPTSQPSSQPSTQPTGQPSFQPSKQPSTQPSAQPSPKPSLSAEPSPSQQPVLLSVQPSKQPTIQPTTQPSILLTEIDNKESNEITMSVGLFAGLIVSAFVAGMLLILIVQCCKQSKRTAVAVGQDHEVA